MILERTLPSYKKKIGVFSFVVLKDILSGQQRRILDLVIGLSEEFDVYYFEISDEDINKSKANFLETSVHYINYKLGYGRIFKSVVNLIYFLLFPFFGVKKSLILARIWSYLNRKKLRKLNLDVIVSEYFMSSYIFNYIKTDTIKIIDMHDIQFVTLKSALREKSSIFKNSQIYFARRIEILMLKKADALISVNTKEIETLQNLGIDSKFFFVPLTINESAISKQKEILEIKEINLAYFAGLSSKRSFEELSYILYNILPPVVVKFGAGVKLFVFGSNPSKELTELCARFSNVELIGQITSISDSFRNIHFSVNFWLGDSYGFRTRVIDVLACGIPILLNKSCVEGMGFSPNNCLVFIEDGNDVVDSIEYYRNNEKKYSLLCKESIETSKLYERTVISKRFNYELLDFLN